MGGGGSVWGVCRCVGVVVGVCGGWGGGGWGWGGGREEEEEGDRGGRE